MLSSIKTNYTPLIEQIAKPFLRIEPNILTLIGLLFPIGFFYFLSHHSPWIALLMLTGSTFDMLDGTVARMSGKSSTFGAILDSSCDRVADGLFIAAFAFAGYISFELMLTVLVGAYLISYIRSRAELAVKGQKSLAIGLMERTERTMILAVMTILSICVEKGLVPDRLMSYGFYLFATLIWLTVYQRLKVARSWN